MRRPGRSTGFHRAACLRGIARAGKRTFPPSRTTDTPRPNRTGGRKKRTYGLFLRATLLIFAVRDLRRSCTAKFFRRKVADGAGRPIRLRRPPETEDCGHIRLHSSREAAGRPAAHPCIRGNPPSSDRLPCCLPRRISRRTGAGRTPMHTASASKAKTHTGAGPSRRIRGRTVEFGVETKNQSRSITCCIVRNTPSRRGRVRRLNATRLRNASGARRWSSFTPP